MNETSKQGNESSLRLGLGLEACAKRCLICYVMMQINSYNLSLLLKTQTKAGSNVKKTFKDFEDVIPTEIVTNFT